WVHPENYPIAREIRQTITTTGSLNEAEIQKLKEKYKAGDTTIRDIIDELKKPGRDPREDYPAPIMRTGAVSFEDLSPGMTVTGKIKNVVDFGAFVDVGLKETALVHISELSDSYVKDPLDLIKVGDVLDFKIIALDADRRRISLSRKTDAGRGAAAPGERPSSGERPASSGGLHGHKGEGGAAKKAPLIRGKSFDPVRSAGSAASVEARRPAIPRSAKDDDGTTYNAFAEAFKRMKERERK
ncbi:MAG: S1 RNA-binding domain-containing protein, partial [Spirochaetaceae bacterium]|nr:S1 RNA-binding domain-containing protein [Spirochaetaceae bacterium]